MTVRSLTLTVLSSALTTLLLLHVGTDAKAQTVTSLAFDVGNSSGCDEIKNGDEIEVLLLIENVTELQQWEATVVYDRDILEIVSQDTRQFLAQDPNSNTIDASEPLPDYNGRHFLGITDVSAATESGDGVLAVLVFQAIAKGSTSISIPQFDINGDGRTDEGAQLVRYGGGFISDANGDQFFDGPVDAGFVAVDADCADVETPRPTDPPTPGPSNGGGTGNSPGASGDGGTGTGVSDPPVGSASAPASGNDSGSGSPSPAATGEAVNSGSATRSPGDDTTDPDGDDGSSFPVWLIAILLASGLAAGAGVVAVALRRNGLR